MLSVSVVVTTVVALVAAVTSSSGGTGCPGGCSCGGIGLSELTCQGGRIYRVRDDGYAEADCQGLPLECSSIPPLPTPAPLHRLELTNCSLPPGAAACLVRALHSPPPEVLMTMALVEGVEEGAFGGLEGVQEVIMMNADSQTRVPPLSPLSPVRLRVVGGTNLTLPSTPLPPTLQSLEVSDSGVRSLNPAAFRGLNDLNTLRVWGNELEEIADEVFESLPSLRTLSLSRNPLKRLNLSRARRLESLTAFRVHLDTLREGDVSGLLELKEMTIESTANLTLSPRSLSSLPSLRSLSVSHSGVTSLPPSLLEGTDSLVNVSFKWNRLDTISEHVFQNKSEVERLDLSHNSIRAITRDSFVGMKSLKELNMDYNLITTLPERALSSLEQLTSVSLSHNLVTSVSPTALPPSPLRTLVLSHNLLPYSPPLPAPGSHDNGEGTLYFDLDPQSPFNTLLELEVLDLSYNNISYMFFDWRYVLIRRLKVLDLSHNSFTDLNSGDLQFLQSDLTLDLTYNNITWAMPPSPSPHSPPTTTSHSPTILLDHNPYVCDCNLYPLVTSLPALPNYHLGDARCALPSPLRHTPLATVDADSLTCPLPLPASPHNSCLVRPHRDRVECTGSDLQTLPNPREHGLPYNTGLYLRLTNNVKLSELPEYVTELNMSKLGLEDIEDIGYVPITVKYIDVSYNKLKRFPLQLLEGNRTLSLRGNVVVCDCWNMDAVRHLQMYKSKIEDFKYVYCESGGGVGVVDASALCDMHRAVAIGSILAVLGIMLAVILTLTWRYSVEIRLYLSSIPGLEFLLDEEKFDEKKVFDIFVSFSHEDFPWVRDTLMPALDLEYKVCVHYREWQVGQPIPLQIQRSVDQSRRTIVVLSTSFINSMWAVEEFRAACAASARDNTARAIVLMLEEVDLTPLHDDLRNYLSLTTYLEANDPKFWEKLKRALPRHPKKRPPRPEEQPGDPNLTPTHPKLLSLLTAIKNRFKQPSVIDLPDPMKVSSDPKKVSSDPKSLDVILDQNGQLVNRGFVKDI